MSWGIEEGHFCSWAALDLLSTGTLNPWVHPSAPWLHTWEGALPKPKWSANEVNRTTQSTTAGTCQVWMHLC